MWFVTRLHALAKQGETYRVGKAVQLCRVIKSNRLAVSTELGKVMFPASHRLDSRCVFFGMGVDFCETVWDNSAQGVEGCEPWWLQYKIWELAGLIVSPPRPNNPQSIKPDFYQLFITAYPV